LPHALLMMVSRIDPTVMFCKRIPVHVLEKFAPTTKARRLARSCAWVSVAGLARLVWLFPPPFFVSSPWMFSECSLNVLWMFSGCFLVHRVGSKLQT